MGYLDSILGFGSNHLNFSLNLLFKQITKVSDNSIIPMNETEIFKYFDKEELEFTLQDDIQYFFHPEERSFEVLNEDDYYEVVNDNYISIECGCQVGSVGTCFNGIRILRCDGDAFKGKYKEDTENLEDTIIAAKLFITKLISQNRFPANSKLILRSNCCS